MRGRWPVLLALATAGAGAQTSTPLSTGGRAWELVPTVGVGMTATSNVDLSANDKQSDLILQVIPGFSLSGQSATLRGFVNYALTASVYAQSKESNSFLNSLNAQITAEPIENRLFIDANASITQQDISPLGQQSPDPSLGNPNRTEVSTLGLAPYLKGQIAAQVDYEARAFYTYTDSGTSQASNSSVWGGLLHFDSSPRATRVGWAADISYRSADFSEGRSSFDQFNVFSLTYAVTPVLRLALRGNYESSDLTSADTISDTGLGAGLLWNPSPRTLLFLEYDQRVFGSTHLYSFSYRTPRTMWVLSSLRSLSTGQYNGGRGSPGSAYDLLFAQFASIEPDPVKREQLVISFMNANGIKANPTLSTGYLPSAVQLQQRDELSTALLGIRDTVLFSLYRITSQNLAPPSATGTNANGVEVDWFGGEVNWVHRLTPLSTLTASGAAQRTTTAQPAGSATTLWTGTILWTKQIAERMSLSLSARRTVFSGDTAPYNESALLASVNVRF
jgi:uncharacterized protein (PEP-CTERM system associated)